MILGATETYCGRILDYDRDIENDQRPGDIYFMVIQVKRWVQRNQE